MMMITMEMTGNDLGKFNEGIEWNELEGGKIE